VRKQIILALLTVPTQLFSQCTVGSNQPPPRTSSGIPTAFPAGFTVDVYMLSGNLCGTPCYYSQFSPDAQTAISRAILAWNAAKVTNNSNVVLNNTWSNPPNPPAAPSIEFENTHGADISGNYGLTTQAWNYYPGAGWRLGAVVVNMNDAMTNSHFIQHIAAHEIGHSFALENCSTCSIPSTVMEAGLVGLNDPTNGATAPTACDSAQVKATAFP